MRAPSELWAHAGVAYTQLALSNGAFLRLRVLGALPGEPLQNWGGLGQAFTPGSPRQPHQQGQSSSRQRESCADLETDSREFCSDPFWRAPPPSTRCEKDYPRPCAPPPIRPMCPRRQAPLPQRAHSLRKGEKILSYNSDTYSVPALCPILPYKASIHVILTMTRCMLVI